MWIDEKKIDDIRQEANIVDIISKYVQLTERGHNHFGHCPFHEDQTPSFSVHEEKQFYHCFSCGRGGNVFSFIMEMEGLTFPQAVAKVAELAGLPLEGDWLQAHSHGGKKEKSQEDYLIDLHQTAASFYHQILTQTETGMEALDYLHQRGLTDHIIEHFRLGYSPVQKGALADYVRGTLNVDDQYLDQSALFYQSQSGDYLDRFSQRLIFPISNQRDEIVAFSGRYLDLGQEDFHDQAPAKYVNSTETPIFNKSQILFNFSKARPEIRRQNEVILFEGYMDVIASWQAGVKHGIASMGTSLSSDHIQLLEKVCDKIVLAFDGDDAGQDATHRAIELLKDQLLTVEVVPFAKGEDPDDFIQQRGASAFQDLIDHGRLTVMGFYLEYYRRHRRLENESDRLDYIDLVLKKLVDIPQAIEREMVLKRLADEFQLSLGSLKDEFHHILQDHHHQQLKNRHQVLTEKSQPADKVQISYQPAARPCEKAENIILYRLFQEPEEVKALIEARDDFEFQTATAQLLALVFMEFYQTVDSPSLSKFMDYVQENKLKERLAKVASMVMTEAYDEEEVLDSIQFIEQDRLQSQIQELKSKMRDAVEVADIDQQNECLQQILTLTQKIEGFY